jgi:hypothetical protein
VEERQMPMTDEREADDRGKRGKGLVKDRWRADE